MACDVDEKKAPRRSPGTSEKPDHGKESVQKGAKPHVLRLKSVLSTLNIITGSRWPGSLKGGETCENPEGRAEDQGVRLAPDTDHQLSQRGSGAIPVPTGKEASHLLK